MHEAHHVSVDCDTSTETFNEVLAQWYKEGYRLIHVFEIGVMINLIFERPSRG